LIDAYQLLTLSLIEGCSQHELLQHVASLPAAVHNRKTFGYLSLEVKIFDLPNLTLTFQQHKELTRKQFEEFAAFVKTHSLDMTEKLLDHLHANKLVRFIHQAARHTDMAADAKTL